MAAGWHTFAPLPESGPRRDSRLVGVATGRLRPPHGHRSAQCAAAHRTDAQHTGRTPQHTTVLSVRPVPRRRTVAQGAIALGASDTKNGRPSQPVSADGALGGRYAQKARPRRIPDVMPRSPAVIRQVAAYRLAFAVTALTVLLTAVSAATAAGFASATTGAAVRGSLTPSPASAILVTAAATLARADADSQQVSRALRAASPGLPLTITTSTWSEPLNLPPGDSAAARAQAQAQVILLPGLRRHARLLRGSWPRGPAPSNGSGSTGSGSTVISGLSADAARLLHLTVGQTLTLRDSVTGAALRVRVSGVYQPLSPSSIYWSLDPLGHAPVAREAGLDHNSGDNRK